MTTVDSFSSSWTLSPSLSRASSRDLSSLCSVTRDSRMKQSKSAGSFLLKLPDLSVPSILRTPTKNLSRLRDHPPRTPSFSRKRVSCCRNSSPNISRSSTPISKRRTPRSGSAPRTPRILQFPSPLFCSSPTRVVPLYLGTPASTPHCPSPIRLKPLNKTSNSCPLEEERRDGELECIVRIAGRRLFESGCSLSPWTPEKNRSQAKDKVRLIQFQRFVIFQFPPHATILLHRLRDLRLLFGYLMMTFSRFILRSPPLSPDWTVDVYSGYRVQQAE